MSDSEWLASRFETHRAHLRAVAYRMLGSLTEADDVVQEAWFRLSRSDTSDVENLRGWLTTVVARLCLDALRTRRSRHEQPVGLQLPEPVIARSDGTDPEREALIADSVGLAMMVVLDTLPPAERLAFVLHDVFGVPFDEIGEMVDRTPMAARQLASRARRRLQGRNAESDVDLAGQRKVVDAFLAASREGNFEALLSLLDPAVVARADFGAGRLGLNRELHGPAEVLEQALMYRHLAPSAQPITVNGGAGLAVYAGGAPYAVLAFTVRGGRIVEIDIVADPAVLRRALGAAN